MAGGASGKKKATGAVIGVISASFIVLLGGASYVAYSRYLEADRLNNPERFAQGVRVAGIEVGNMTREEARETVRDWAKKQSALPVTFTAPQSGRKWNIPLAEVGGRFDIETPLQQAFAVGKNVSTWEKIVQGGRRYERDFTPEFRLNEIALDRQIKRIAEIVYRPAVNATAKITDTGAVVLASAEKKGVSLDTKTTKTALLKSGPDALRDGETVTLVVQEERPTVTAASLGKMGSVLASFTTDYSSSPPPRRRNVELAASKVNGTMLAPGDVFSYNGVVGPRETRYGFQNALMFEDGEVVPGVGGGICQVSSTLYNAVVRADLKVVERSNHSVKVTYVKPGCDATVVYGARDFRFENSTPGPILLLARMKNRRLTMNIYGLAPAEKKQVELVTGPIRYNSYGGVTVSAYKLTKYADGKTTREYLHTDTYRPASTPSRPSRPRPRRIARTPKKAEPLVRPAGFVRSSDGQ